MGAFVEFGGAGMLGDEALFFALMESAELAAVDGAHGFESRKDRRNDGNGQGAAREGVEYWRDSIKI